MNELLFYRIALGAAGILFALFAAWTFRLSPGNLSRFEAWPRRRLPGMLIGWAALAICGILAGGYFTALPVRSGGVRAVFGVSFALTVFLLPGHAFAAQTLQIALFPILFASTILWSERTGFCAYA